MPLWGSGREGSEKKPTYLNTAEQQVTYATPKGWTQPAQGISAARAATADREVLVAIGGLSKAQATEKTGIAAATISSVNWNISTFKKDEANVLSVSVNYNEAVTVAVSNPTIVVVNGNEGSGSGRGPYTLTHNAATSTANRLTFEWAIAAGHGSTNPNDVLVIQAQSVVLASSSTISDADGVVGAQGLVITAAQALAAGTITVTAS